MTKCLLFEKNMPKKFWLKVLNTIIYSLNKLPTRALGGSGNPYEAWHGNNLSLQHLRVFNCICYNFVSKIKREKLDLEVEIRILLVMV